MAARILYVCTGNICRSPMAELALRARASTAEVQIFSAGLRALVGEQMDTASAAALSELGIDPSRHRARQFEPWMANAVDLVLTADQEHRDALLTQAPGALRRTFTMREFARLARHQQRVGSAQVIADLADQRGIDGAVEPGLDDIVDPYRGTIAQARTTLGLIAATVDATIHVLGLGATRPRPRRRPRPFRE